MIYKKYNLLLFCISALLSTAYAGAQDIPGARPESVGLSSERLHNMSVVFREQVDQGALPGVTFMVARKGKIAHSDAIGFRNISTRQPMTTDSIFRLYSMTKPLVSVAAMILVEDGAIQLTDPVSKFLPELKRPAVSFAQVDAQFARTTYSLRPSEREMTVQDLLRHTSGLIYGEISSNKPVKDAYQRNGLYKTTTNFDIRDQTPQQQVAAVSNAPLAHQPGTVWEYSIASDLLGRVVEAESGMRLAEFLEKRLFVPLKMADSGFWVEKDDIGRIAEPPTEDHSGNKTVTLIDVSVVPANDSGGAGGVSTVGDYLRFCQMLLNGGHLDGRRVLSRNSVALMSSDHIGNRIAMSLSPGELLLGVPGYTFGLGFAVRKEQGIAGVPGSKGEYTWGGYAGTYFFIDPVEQIAAVYMSQAPGPTRAYYRRLFRQLVYAAIID